MCNQPIRPRCSAEISCSSSYSRHGSLAPSRSGRLCLIQLNSTAKEKRKTGSLYAVLNLARSPVDESQWFQLRVTVNGKHITIHLNDQPVVDYTEPDNATLPPDA
jgi:hypothetical protein